MALRSAAWSRTFLVVCKNVGAEVATSVRCNAIVGLTRCDRVAPQSLISLREPSLCVDKGGAP